VKTRGHLGCARWPLTVSNGKPFGLEAIATVAAVAATAATTTTAAVATATTAAATESTTTAATTTATATGGVFAGTGFVDGQGAAFVLLAVERGNGGLGFGVVGHFNEAKTFAAAGVAIVDDLRAFDLAVRGKQLFQGRAIDLVAQIAHV